LVWIRHNDSFYSHPKVIHLGALVLEAVGLDTLASCWSGQQLTDGHIPGALVVQLARRRVPKIVDSLLATGLWDRCSEHSECYLIHDFLDRNPSKDDVVATRQKRAAAGGIGGKHSPSKPEANGKQTPSKPEANGKQTPSKSPGFAKALLSPRTRPVPDPLQASNEALPPISPTTALSSAPNSAGVPRVKSDDVISVFEAFQERHPRAVLTDDRRKLIARFVKGHGAAVCIAATKGIVYSPHHMGDNDRGEKYDSLEAIFKNARNVELFSGYELDPGTRPTGHPRGRVERTIRGRELDPALLARAYPVLARD